MNGSASRNDATPGTRPPYVAITITAIAVLLAAAHMMRPDLQVDAAVLVLAVIAATPWLAPFVKSIKLPGGVEVELQEMKEEVQVLGKRVQEAERIAIAGAVSADLSHAMRSQLGLYQRHLTEIGLAAPDPPSVKVEEGLIMRENAVSGYFGDGIRIDATYARDTDWVLRDYTHFILTATLKSPDYGEALVESGVAAYFVCTFRDDPVFGRKTLSMHGVKERTFRLEAATGINATAPADEAEHDQAHREQTEAWGAMLWDIRKLVGSLVCDEIVARAWIAACRVRSDGGLRAAFPSSMLSEIDRSPARTEIDAIRTIMRERGAPLS
jgi:hypothetical protein